MTVSTAESYEAACQAGLGIIQAPMSVLAPQVARGELVEVLPQYRPAPMPVSLVYPNRRNLPVRVQVFMHWVAEQLAPHLAPITPDA